MAGNRFRHRVEELLALANVRLDGDRPWDLQVRDERLFARILAHGSLGLGESYTEGWWECERLDEFVYRVQRARLKKKINPWRDLPIHLRARFFNLQKKSRAFEIGRIHYDLGRDLYERMLDRRMIYSCGYWQKAKSLDAAQEAKLELCCRKLRLERGMRLLDIGCGWGGTLQYAAEHYGVEAVGITVSKDQAERARQVCAGLPVEIRLQDYREVRGSFDRVLSIGMFEHVGVKNYRTYMEVVRRCTKEEGLFLLHTIGGRRSSTSLDPWMQRYIFPNSMLPSARQIAQASEGLLIMEDWQNFGADYDRTLMEWCTNFEAHWPEIAEKYGERFYRMWRYYLLTCAGSFRARRNQLWQIVFSPQGVPGGYLAPR